MRSVLLALLVVVMMFFLINSYGSTTTILTLTGVRARAWAALFLTILGFSRLLWHITLPKRSLIASSVIGFVCLVVGLVLGIWAYFEPPNYVYSLFKLQPFPLVVFGNTMGIVLLMSLPKKFLKKYGLYILAALPIWFLAMAWWVTLLPFNKFVDVIQEDGFVETMQVMILVVTTILLLFEVNFSFKAKQIKKTVAMAFLTAAFLFTTMEEISWGQRIFDVQTPDALIEINVQKETNIHNIGVFNSLQDVGYITISMMGSLGGIAHAYWRRSWNKWIPKVLPWYLLIPGFYYIAYVFYKEIHPFSEIMEMLFYGGVFLWVFANLKFVRSRFVRV